MLRKALMMICLAAGIFSVSGCIFLAAGAAGVGTAKWYSDKVSQEIDKPLAKVVDSVKDTLKGLKINVYKETSAPEVTQILANYSDGRKIWVDVRPVGTDKSRVDLRVGWMSGKEDSQKLLEQIVKNANSWL